MEVTSLLEGTTNLFIQGEKEKTTTICGMEEAWMLEKKTEEEACGAGSVCGTGYQTCAQEDIFIEMNSLLEELINLSSREKKEESIVVEDAGRIMMVEQTMMSFFSDFLFFIY